MIFKDVPIYYSRNIWAPILFWDHFSVGEVHPQLLLLNAEYTYTNIDIKKRGPAGARPSIFCMFL